MSRKDQETLFPLEKLWRQEWQGMPEFEQPCAEAVMSVTVHFVSYADMHAFAALVGSRILPTTKSLFYPPPPVTVRQVYTHES
jgi:hypothetical protein